MLKPVFIIYEHIVCGRVCVCYAKKGQCVAFSRHIRVNIKALCIVCACVCVFAAVCFGSVAMDWSVGLWHTLVNLNLESSAQYCQRQELSYLIPT